MKRRAKNLFCFLALLVFVGSVTLGVRSCFVSDDLSCMRSRHDPAGSGDEGEHWLYDAHSECGIVSFLSWHWSYADDTSSSWEYKRRTLGPSDPYWRKWSGNRIDFHLGDFTFTYDDSGIQGIICCVDLAFPLWILLPTAIPPILWLRRARKARRGGFPITPVARA